MKRFGALEFERSLRVLPPVGSIKGYSFAVILLILGSAIRLVLQDWAGEPLPPFIILSFCIVLSAFVGGIKVGLFAVAISILVTWYFWIPTFNSWEITTRRDALTIGVYSITGSLMAIVSGGARLLSERLAASEAKSAVQTQESIHRVKNLLAIVSALTNRAARGAETVAEFKGRLDNKLSALGIAQGLLLKTDAEDAPLNEVVSQSLAPFLINSNAQIEDGPAVMLPREYVTGVTMALYELATNSLKYGALATNGTVKVFWKSDNKETVLIWTERTVDLSAGTINHGDGFGRRLIAMTFGGAPGTSVEYGFSGGALECRFCWSPNKAG